MFIPLPMAGGWHGFRNRPVALIGRASDSKSEGWGFESLLACINLFEGYVFKGN